MWLVSWTISQHSANQNQFQNLSCTSTELRNFYSLKFIALERFHDTFIIIIDMVLGIFCQSRVKGRLLSNVKSAGQLPKCLLVAQLLGGNVFTCYKTWCLGQRYCIQCGLSGKYFNSISSFAEPNSGMFKSSISTVNMMLWSPKLGGSVRLTWQLEV